MGWGKVTELLGALVDGAWPSMFASGVVVAAVGLITLQPSVLLDGLLFAAAGGAVSYACYRAGRPPWNQATHVRPEEPWPVEDALDRLDIAIGVEQPASTVFRDRLASSSRPGQVTGRTLH
jgi:hypothetical protein